MFAEFVNLLIGLKYLYIAVLITLKKVQFACSRVGIYQILCFALYQTLGIVTRVIIRLLTAWEALHGFVFDNWLANILGFLVFVMVGDLVLKVNFRIDLMKFVKFPPVLFFLLHVLLDVTWDLNRAHFVWRVTPPSRGRYC